MQDIVLNIENELNQILKKDNKKNNTNEQNVINLDMSNNRINNIKILILSGGGTRGMTYYGVLKALDELNILKNIHTFATTSVGSFFACMYLIGYNTEELIDFMYLFDVKKLSGLDSYENIPFLDILQNFGLDDGENIHIIFNKLLKAKGLKENMTLLELYNITKKKFISTCVCINTKEAVYISHENFPELRISDAVRMSSCFPFYYKPVIYKNKYYVDGGLINNYPINLFKDNIDEVVGILMDNKYEYAEINTFQSFFYNCLLTFMRGISYNSFKGWEKYTIIIEVKQLNVLQFDMTKEFKNNMYKLGYNSVMDYFKIKKKIN